MEIFRPVIRESATKSVLQERYPTDLNMYVEVPSEQIQIEEFQEIAVERVKLLKVFETVNAKGIKDGSYKEQVINEATKQNIKFFLPLIKGFVDYDSRRYDHLSHFILRLYYCQSEEYRKWFIARELEFFRLKFMNTEKKEDVLLFMEKHNLHYAPISDEERKALAIDIINSTAKNINLETTNIYKVPYVQVLDLVKGRKVFLKNGFAYVPHQDLGSVLSSIFRSKLSHALSICSANASSLERDERLGRILRGLHNGYADSDYYVKAKDNIPLSSLDSLSVKSYPLCMRQMHETFKRTHHLRYMARLEYGLFLKGIGVSLEDSLRFWREGFTKREGIDADMFEKTYAYCIRHSYGKEGKRVNYTPHSCIRIISSNVAPSDNHGCPFKHSDVNTLRQKLISYGLTINDASDIINYVSNGHYQLACTRYFEVVHNVTNAKGIYHPNLYFEESQKILSSKISNTSNSSEKEVSLPE